MFRSLSRQLATKALINTPSKLQDVVIIGGGPAGLSLLAALKSSNKTKHLKCTLVEGASLDPIRNFGVNPPPEYTNRVVSLTPKTIEYMRDKIGNWNFINQERVNFYDTIVAYDSQDNEARIKFDASTIGDSVLAAMCENLNIQSSLLERIEELNLNTMDPDQKSILYDNTKVVDITGPEVAAEHELPYIDPKEGEPDLDWPTVTLSNGESLQARLLVGADGFNSSVRKFSHIASRGWFYNRFGVVATVKLQYEDYRSLAWQRFLTTGPLAILPLTDNNATIVWSSTPELSELLISVDDEIFPYLVNAAMALEETDLSYIYSLLKKNPSDMNAVEEIKWRMSRVDLLLVDEGYPLPLESVVPRSRARFPLKMAHADTYTAPRVALIGDAAHSIHPLAGQGLNMGQSDVASLVSALEDGVTRGLDIGSTLVLEQYTANAWPSNHVMLGICDKMHKIFSTDWPPIVFFRGFGIKSLNMLGSFKDVIVRALSGR